MLPAPICIKKLDEPLPDTPFNITVIRLTHEGILVKSLDVPDVVACAVADTKGLITAVASATVVPDTITPVVVIVGLVIPSVPDMVTGIILFL